MRTIDLNCTEDPILTHHSDVCIIGAGAAGLYLAVRLMNKGIDVTIVEAGDKNCVDGADLGIETEFGAEFYSGAIAGRFFGLGGSTSKWGGAMVPHVPIDHTAIDAFDTVWQHVMDCIDQHSATVLQTLGLPQKPAFQKVVNQYFPEQTITLEQCGILPMSTLFLPFKRKNFSTLLNQGKSGKGRLTLVLNAVATAWEWQEKGKDAHITKCIAKNKQHKKITLQSYQFVVAAGAIESTRILLELNRQSGDKVLKENRLIGHYLSDHLSSNIADIHLNDQKMVAKTFGPRFFRGDMRSFRFLEKKKPPGSPRSFFHFIFEIDNPGFLLAKKVLSSLQSRSIPEISFSEVTNAIASMSALGYQRFIHNRLRIPKGTSTHLQLDIEQTPCYNNRIELLPQKDIYGRSKSIIYWNITDDDYQKINDTAQRFLEKWPIQRFVFPRLVFRKVGLLSVKPHDAYHPVGTCRMGRDVTSVVDMDLKVRGISNVHILSTAVFPTAGSANPTFSMLCLGERLTQHLQQKLVCSSILL